MNVKEAIQATDKFGNEHADPSNMDSGLKALTEDAGMDFEELDAECKALINAEMGDKPPLLRAFAYSYLVSGILIGAKWGLENDRQQS